MKEIRKLSVILFAVMLCVGIKNIPAFAATTSQDGLEVTLTTDKEEYNQGEEIIATITVKNTNDFTVKNVSLQGIVPEGYELVKDAEAIKTVENLKAGEKLIVAVTYVTEENRESDDSNKDTDTDRGEKPQNPPAPELNDDNKDVEKEDLAIDTGDANRITLWSVLLVLALGGTVTVLVLNKKNRKGALLLLCLTMGGASMASPLIKSDAADIEMKTIEIETLVEVDGKEIILKAEVNYQYSYGKEKKYTVVFETNGGNIIKNQVVKEGQIVVEPDTPTKEGFEFVGWYGDEELSLQCDFTKPVTKDLTLYAKWEKIYIPSEDASDYFEEGLYADIGDEENIEFNKETFEEYFNNEIIVLLDEELSKETDKKVLDLIKDSKIVGKNIYTKSYQIRLDSEKTYKELQEILQKVKEAGYEKSHLNRVMRLASSVDEVYYPNDLLWSNIWSEDAVGPNWGMEAIKAPKVWKYKEYMKSITVGVLDTGFDVEHDDLKNVIKVVNKNTVGDDQSHGTHVSGIIGAEFDNEWGVCGVCPTANIQGIVYTNIKSEYVFITGITRLVKGGSRVINISLGNTADFVFAASQAENIELAFLIQEQIKAEAVELSYHLEELLKNDDFVICTSAGNVEGSRIIKKDDSVCGYAYVKKDKKTEKNMVFYRDSNSLEEVSYEITQEDCKNEITTETITKVIDAFWDKSLSAITDEKVKSRIIVVGAASLDKYGNYIKSSFSSDGNRVDVIAPGEAIYSTIEGNSYNYKQGTSMAAPHVAGLAGMLYALNPNLTGDQVKDIIIRGATIEVANAEGKKMINAWDSYKILCNTPLEEMGELTGIVVDENGIPIEGATVTVGTAIDNESNYKTTTDADGKFTVVCETGNQTYTVSKHGYISHTGTENVECDTTTIIFKKIILEKMADMPDLEDPDKPEVFEGFAGGDGSLENPYQISTAVQLDAIRLDLEANYELVNDIDLSDWGNWSPIGEYYYNRFQGNLDGNNYSINNMTIEMGYSDNAAIGFIADVKVDASITNLRITNAKIKTQSDELQYVGIICGYNNGLIHNCLVSGSISGPNGEGKKGSILGNFSTGVGGIAGYNHRGTIKYCKVTNLEQSRFFGGAVGGIVGHNNNMIYGCEVENINIESRTSGYPLLFAGGIAGRNSCYVYYCKSKANVVVNGKKGVAVGGIVGGNAGFVDYCYFNGTVFGEASAYSSYGTLVGGIVGSNHDEEAVGSNGDITNCVSLTYDIICSGKESYFGTVENNYTNDIDGKYVIDSIEKELINITIN